MTDTETDDDDTGADAPNPVEYPAGRSTTGNAEILRIEAMQSERWDSPDVNRHVPARTRAGYDAAMQARQAVERARGGGENEAGENDHTDAESEPVDERPLSERDGFNPAEFENGAEDDAGATTTVDEPPESDGEDLPAGAVMGTEDGEEDGDGIGGFTSASEL